MYIFRSSILIFSLIVFVKYVAFTMMCVLRKERKARPSVGHLCLENSTDRGVWWATVSSWSHNESDMTEQPNPCMRACTHTHTHTHSLFLHRGSAKCFGNKRGIQRLVHVSSRSGNEKWARETGESSLVFVTGSDWHQKSQQKEEGSLKRAECVRSA